MRELRLPHLSLSKKVFLTSSQTRPTALGSRLKRLRLAAAHSLTLARLRAATYTPPEKMVKTLFASADANSARLFRRRQSRFAENCLATPNRGGGKTKGFDGEVYPIPLAERIIVRITRRQEALNKISHNLVYSQYSIRQNAKNPAKIFAGFLLCLIAAACHILLL